MRRLKFSIAALALLPIRLVCAQDAPHPDLKLSVVGVGAKDYAESLNFYTIQAGDQVFRPAGRKVQLRQRLFGQIGIAPQQPDDRRPFFASPGEPHTIRRATRPHHAQCVRRRRDWGFRGLGRDFRHGGFRRRNPALDRRAWRNLSTCRSVGKSSRVRSSDGVTSKYSRNSPNSWAFLMLSMPRSASRSASNSTTSVG